MDIPQEESCGFLAVANDWPYQGQIEFHNVILRYLPSLPPALSDISFTILGGSQVSMSSLPLFLLSVHAHSEGS